MQKPHSKLKRELIPNEMLETSSSVDKGVVLSIYPQEAKRQLDTSYKDLYPIEINEQPCIRPDTNGGVRVR